MTRTEAEAITAEASRRFYEANAPLSPSTHPHDFDVPEAFFDAYEEALVVLGLAHLCYPRDDDRENACVKGVAMFRGAT